MSFFIRGKQVNGVKRSKFSKDDNKKHKKRKAPSDEEITSSEDEGLTEANKDEILSDNDNETVQEKKLRLAKVYLEEIERQEKKRLQEEEVDQSVISRRLKDDYLKQVGKFRSHVADEYEKFDEENIKYLKCKEHKNTITCICVSSDDKFLYSGSKDGTIVKWTLTDYKKCGSIPFVKNNGPKFLGHSKKIMCLALSTDNKFLVVGDESPDIQVWDPETLAHIKTLKSHKAAVTGVCIKKESHELYSCSKDRSVKVWSLDEMAYVETLYGHQDAITSIDALHKDRAITAGGRDTTLRVWKITTESQLIYNGHTGSIDIVKLINEDNFMSGGDDGQLCVWSLLKKKPICAIKESHGCDPVNGLPFWISSVTALVNTDLVASGSNNGTIKIWKLSGDFRSIDLLFEVPVVGFINDMSFTSDGTRLIASCGKDHRFGRWSTVKEAKNAIAIIPFCKYKRKT